ncbi:PAS domain-containing sensor histidine kinase [Companilactobacillus sp. RD055328]|uniref:cell wall metabolism sensor histidine kinase WalK n=1 Tax=Companilactobacillus sp. RD055328 TaxID=2916634 RepID=UPI001FC8713D|nr:cell wall metabolism sensor histidine kinase WalK [Companilactobacillus sp. RD055328]GKQ43336.1 PAS domain-containing sensor histidine kinase [Companilactobacillus sp. RD055328]
MNKKIKFMHSIHFKIPFAFILILFATIEIIGAYFVRQIEHQNVQTFESSIQIPQGISTQIATELYNHKSDMGDKIQSSLRDIDNSSISEIQVVDKDGTTVANSDANKQSTIGKKSDAIANTAMYNNQKLTQIVYDKDTGSTYIMVQPLVKTVNDSSNVIGAIYVQANMEQVYKNINNIIIIFLSASLVAGLVGALIAIFISRAITRPIDEMKQQAIQMSQGDYSGQVRVYSEDELGQLALAVNNLSIKVEEETENSESERRRLDSVLSQMSDGVIATNRRGNITVINEMAMEFLNIEDDQEVIQRPIVDVLGIQDEFSFQDILEDQDSILVEAPNNNNDLILNTEFSLIQRDSGFVSGVVVVLHDVTEQQRVDRERKEFVSNVSHELRTPLTSIRSYVETLNDGAWEDKELAPKFLKVTVEETERMIRMINDLLSLSRMDQGTSKLELEYVNFNEFFNYILNRFDMMLTKDKEHAKENGTKIKDYTIKRVFTKHDLWVEIDTDKMTQVIDNIVNNAIKYSPDGGVITCRLLETNKHVIISINDQGLGIPRNDQIKIFDRFYRVDKARSRKQGGTGLGLSISKEVVEEHKGKVWVNSSEGKGSTFYISLPYDANEGIGEWDED